MLACKVSWKGNWKDGGETIYFGNLSYFSIYLIKSFHNIEIHQNHEFNCLRGAIKKKYPEKWKKSKRGGRGQRRRSKKSTIQNVDFLIRGGGGHIFIFFPNVNAHFKYFRLKKNKLVLKWFLGNFKCFKLMFHIWGGVPKIQSFPNFKSFPNSKKSKTS